MDSRLPYSLALPPQLTNHGRSLLDDLASPRSRRKFIRAELPKQQLSARVPQNLFDVADLTRMGAAARADDATSIAQNAYMFCTSEGLDPRALE